MRVCVNTDKPSLSDYWLAEPTEDTPAQCQRPGLSLGTGRWADSSQSPQWLPSGKPAFCDSSSSSGVSRVCVCLISTAKR